MRGALLHESSRTFENGIGAGQEGEPEATERRAQAVERGREFSAPLSGTVAPYPE